MANHALEIALLLRNANQVDKQLKIIARASGVAAAIWGPAT